MTTGPIDYDAELTRYSAALRRAWAIRPHDHVLDIGCGAGQTTREAGRLAPAGSALGVDVSAAAVARAEPAPNVTFVRADAQTHDFPPGHFDLAISRFGTMFFDDPVAAFTNIGRALRPGGRLVMLVWQGADRNQWTVAIHDALGVAERPAAPFSLADPPVVERILKAAGFRDVELTDLAEPVYYGPGTDAALAFVRGFACTNEALDRLGPDEAAAALDRLRDLFAAHRAEDGVWFDSRAWLVTAVTGPRVRIVHLDGPALRALAAGDRAAAERLGPVPLSPYLTGPECRGVWQRRAEQVERDPAGAAWVTGVIWDEGGQVAVGRAGFHAPPDADGLVEIGYAVDPAYRRRGHARAALEALLARAAADPLVRRVRVSIRPDNEASYGLVEQYGFAKVGEQWDDEDGLEFVYEIPADQPSATGRSR